MIYPWNQQTCDEATRLLRQGEIVAVPTETVYGLAADATQIDAVLKVFAIKQRPSFDPLIVHTHLSSVETLAAAGWIDPHRISAESQAVARQLMRSFWPGPLTLLLPRGPKVLDAVTSGSELVAIRCPAHPILRSLLESSKLALAAPSANPFGRVSPTKAEHVAADFGKAVPFIIDGGPCELGLESTVVGLSESGEIFVHRLGSLPLESLPPCALVTSPTEGPGTLKKHYAPTKPLFWRKDLEQPAIAEWLLRHYAGAKVRHITRQNQGYDFAFSDNTERYPWPPSSTQAAKELFQLMRQVSSFDVIIFDEVPARVQLWPAVADRIDKARNHWVEVCCTSEILPRPST